MVATTLLLFIMEKQFSCTNITQSSCKGEFSAFPIFDYPRLCFPTPKCMFASRPSKALNNSLKTVHMRPMRVRPND